MAIQTVKIVYQKGIGRMLPKVCIYEPSCSNFMIEAVEKHGFFTGIFLGTWRLLRCHPFARGGYDPVPEKGFKLLDVILLRDTTQNTEDTEN